MDNEPATLPKDGDFSLVLGGPLYQLFVRSRLAKPPLELVHRRLFASVVMTYVPLAVLSAQGGTLVGNAKLPFLYDLSNLRFLVSIPLLIWAEVIVHKRVRTILGQFLSRGLVAPEDRAAFDAIIARGMRLRNSVAIEVALLLLSFTAGYWMWRTYAAVPVSTWYATPASGSISLSWAGLWYAFVSLPLGRFLVIRWYYRFFIWYVVMWQVSRLPLRLNPLHPDCAGGLGFLDLSVAAFSPVLMAQSVFLAGVIANQILYFGASLPDFKIEIIAFVVFFMLVVLLPMIFFSGQMLEAKLTASREFGGLASRYAREFRLKWLAQGEPTEEALLGTADIQSLADLVNSYEVVRTMRLVPVSNLMVLWLTLLIGLPLIPLVLTMIPLSELVKRLVTLLM